jgi:deoxyribonuclease V
MRIHRLHSFRVTPAAARAIQERLRGRVRLSGDDSRIRTVAGADVALDPRAGIGFAAVVLFRLPGLVPIETRTATGTLRFPYIPGLLSFREAPVLLKAFSRLQTVPDLILFDGQGIAHPRRFGLASHLGLILDRPAIGCAKSRLIGEFTMPAVSRGSRTALRIGDEQIGHVVRTRDGVRPIFVSPGHRIGFSAAVRAVLRCTDGFRIPKPTREADRLVGEMKRRR